MAMIRSVEPAVGKAVLGQNLSHENKRRPGITCGLRLLPDCRKSSGYDRLIGPGDAMDDSDRAIGTVVREQVTNDGREIIDG